LSVAGASNLQSTANVGSTLGVAGVATFSANVATAGVVQINSIIHAYANSYTFTNSTTAAIVDAMPIATYRSAEYMIQLSDATLATPSYHHTRIHVVHNGSVAYVTEYGTVFNNINLGTFDAPVNAGSVNLTLTPASANVAVKFLRTAIVL
jgi:hypothetical protein